MMTLACWFTLARGVADERRPIRHVTGHHGARAHDGIGPDANRRQCYNTRADERQDVTTPRPDQCPKLLRVRRDVWELSLEALALRTEFGIVDSGILKRREDEQTAGAPLDDPRRPISQLLIATPAKHIDHAALRVSLNPE